MKTIRNILLGSAAAVALACATPASAYDHHYHHGTYVYHSGHYGYYHGSRFYVYNAGPYPYYYGPYSPPGPTVVIAPRRHFFFWF
jgi:hypothetical protein